MEPNNNRERITTKRLNTKKVFWGILSIIGIFAILAIIGSMLSSTPANTDTPPTIAPKIENTDVCYFDWQYSVISSIGPYSTAPAGYNYEVVTIYLKNNADKTVSTNPYFWILTADGIEYTVDSSTFSENINHQSVVVAKGGEIETRMVYVVKGDPLTATLNYNGVVSPEFVKIKHY